MTIGDRIKHKREELGMSQEDLARKMGYDSRNAIYRYEHCDNIKFNTVNKFAQALDCTASYLLGWDDINAKEVRELDSDMAVDDFDFLVKFNMLDISEKTMIMTFIDTLLAKKG